MAKKQRKKDAVIAEAMDRLRMLDHPVDGKVLRLLADNGELNVKSICRGVRVVQPVISMRLGRMRDAGLLGSEKRGTEVYYWVNRESVRRLRHLAESIVSI